MKLIFAAATLTAALAVQTKPDAPGPPSPYITQEALNCRWFKVTEGTGQLAYVIGLKEAFFMADRNLATPDATNGETQEGVRAICEAPENASIRAVDAYILFAAKIKGLSESEIKDGGAAARYYATHGEWPPEPPKPPKKAEPTRGKL